MTIKDKTDEQKTKDIYGMLGDRGCFCDYYKRPLGSPWYGINDADILLYTFFDWNRCYFLHFLAGASTRILQLQPG